ncbi:unnamed protein product [Amoebophrya sp. A25]|nr:unnamed protein product [Amoebophrya sp. A25]|eukprot:GSA25T00003964001.1
MQYDDSAVVHEQLVLTYIMDDHSSVVFLIGFLVVSILNELMGLTGNVIVAEALKKATVFRMEKMVEKSRLAVARNIYTSEVVQVPWAVQKRIRTKSRCNCITPNRAHEYADPGDVFPRLQNHGCVLSSMNRHSKTNKPKKMDEQRLSSNHISISFAACHEVSRDFPLLRQPRLKIWHKIIYCVRVKNFGNNAGICTEWARRTVHVHTHFFVKYRRLNIGVGPTLALVVLLRG